MASTGTGAIYPRRVWDTTYAPGEPPRASPDPVSALHRFLYPGMPEPNQRALGLIDGSIVKTEVGDGFVVEQHPSTRSSAAGDLRFLARRYPVIDRETGTTVSIANLDEFLQKGAPVHQFMVVSVSQIPEVRIAEGRSNAFLPISPAALLVLSEKRFLGKARYEVFARKVGRVDPPCLEVVLGIQPADDDAVGRRLAAGSEQLRLTWKVPDVTEMSSWSQRLVGSNDPVAKAKAGARLVDCQYKQVLAGEITGRDAEVVTHVYRELHSETQELIRDAAWGDSACVRGNKRLAELDPAFGEAVSDSLVRHEKQRY